MTPRVSNTSAGTGGRQWAPITPRSDEEIDAGMAAAMAAEERERNRGRRATHVFYDASADTVMIVLLSGFVIGVPSSVIRSLSDVPPESRNVVELTPDGEGIIWPMAGTDASVAGIIDLLSDTLAQHAAEPWRGEPGENTPRIVGRMPVPKAIELSRWLRRSEEEMILSARERRSPFLSEPGDPLSVRVMKFLIRVVYSRR